MNNRQVVHSGLKRWKKNLQFYYFLLYIFKNFINLITKWFFFVKSIIDFICLLLALFAVELSLTMKSSLKIYGKLVRKEISVNSKGH